MSTYSEKELVTTVDELIALPADAYAERLELLRRIIGAAEDQTAAEVASARVSGWSWAQLAPALGTTRQAAHQRYGAA